MTTVNAIQARNDLFDRIRTALDDISVYALAQNAEAASPDALDSPGALFLDNVRTAVLDAVRWQLIDADSMEDYGTGSGADWRKEAISEIGDSAPSVYTHALWSEFVDLAAYREEEAVTEVWGTQGTMENDARACLRSIAERLALALLDEAHSVWLAAQDEEEE